MLYTGMGNVQDVRIDLIGMGYAYVLHIGGLMMPKPTRRMLRAWFNSATSGSSRTLYFAVSLIGTRYAYTLANRTLTQEITTCSLVKRS